MWQMKVLSSINKKEQLCTYLPLSYHFCNSLMHRPLYEFIQLLFLGNKYCDILFPRIPIPIAKELKQKFEEINAQYEDYDEPIETTESEETSANRVTGNLSLIVLSGLNTVQMEVILLKMEIQ